MISYSLNYFGSYLFLIKDVEFMSAGTALQCPKVKIYADYYLFCSSDI
jgi:hypothetical protein